MAKTTAQIIEIVRGRTETFQISVIDATGLPYALGSGEKVVFGVKKHPKDQEVIFAKVASVAGEGLFTVKLQPDDTENLSGGEYWYDVGLESGEDYLDIIKPSPFLIRDNVTSWGCVE